MKNFDNNNHFFILTVDTEPDNEWSRLKKSEMTFNWELNFRVIVATDPFFTAGNEKLRIFQSSLNLKYELQLFIPHDESWLAIASFNHHRDSLVNPYDISYKNNNAKLNSGCLGLGFERLIYGLYCQKGKDIHKWPMRILKDLLLK